MFEVVVMWLQMKPSPPDPSPLDDWEVPKDEFSVGEELGSGYFATVHRGRWKNLINVAIKKLKSGANKLVNSTGVFPARPCEVPARAGLLL